MSNPVLEAESPRKAHPAGHAPHGTLLYGFGLLARTPDGCDDQILEHFHVFGIEWDLNRIIWTLDGVPYQTVTPANLPPGANWVFDHPFFIILNVAVGGNFVGPPSETTPFPQTMLIDWVRVHGVEP